jgi:hypothetical protein
LAVVAGALDRLGATIAQYQPIPDQEFIAFGVPAKIVVIVEHQNFGAIPDALTEAIRRSETADSSSDDHQVIPFPGVLRFAQGLGACAVAHAVRHCEAAVVISAHAHFGGWVVRSLLRPGLVEYRGREELFRWERPLEQARAGAHHNAIQEIAASDPATRGIVCAFFFFAHSLPPATST